MLQGEHQAVRPLGGRCILYHCGQFELAAYLNGSIGPFQKCLERCVHTGPLSKHQVAKAGEQCCRTQDDGDQGSLDILFEISFRHGLALTVMAARQHNNC